MTLPVTLSIYIAREFTWSVIAMLLALSGLVGMFDFIELLRRSTSRPEATFGLVSEMAALRQPYIAMQILPFAVLLGGILCFWRLTRSSELIVARSAGISAWEFLAAPTLCAFLFGALATAVVSPVSSVMFARAEALDNTYLKAVGGPWHSPATNSGYGSPITPIRRRASLSSTPWAWSCTASSWSPTTLAYFAWMAETDCLRASKPPRRHSARERGSCRMPDRFDRKRCPRRQSP